MGTLVAIGMVATLMILAMTRTAYARVKDESCNVATHHGLDITHATSYNFDTTTLKLTQSAIAHTTCEHHLDTHLLQVVGNARLATASLR